MKPTNFAAVSFAALLGVAGAASAQTYTTGQRVFATPTGASNGWYKGCVVGAGRSNSSYQVECGGTTWWVSSENIRLTAPTAVPDPMRPGQPLPPVITASSPSDKGEAAFVPAAPVQGARTRSKVAQPPGGEIASGNYAGNMAKMIAKDKVDATNAVLKTGKYECRSGGQYTFSDIYITSSHSYEVKPGGKGAFSYANGALTFTSGPYAGAYSRTVDGKTIGVSSKGNTNLGTQCEYSN